MEGTNAAIPVTRSSDSTSASFSLNYAFIDINATGGSDYINTPGVLNFAEGQNTAYINVRILSDSSTEPLESFLITIFNGVASDGTFASISNSMHSVYIVDAAPPPPPPEPEPEPETPTVSLTPTITVKKTPTSTLTLSSTPTLSSTISITPTPTVGVTPTKSATLTPTLTLSTTSSLTASPTKTVSQTPTLTLSPVSTPTFPTPTVTVTHPTPTVTETCLCGPPTCTPRQRPVTPTVSLTLTVSRTSTITVSTTPTVSASPFDKFVGICDGPEVIIIDGECFFKTDETAPKEFINYDLGTGNFESCSDCQDYIYQTGITPTPGPAIYQKYSICSTDEEITTSGQNSIFGALSYVNNPDLLVDGLLVELYKNQSLVATTTTSNNITYSFKFDFDFEYGAIYDVKIPSLNLDYYFDIKFDTADLVFVIPKLIYGISAPELSGVALANGSNKITVKRVEGAVEYKIYKSVDCSGSYTYLDSINPLGLDFEDYFDSNLSSQTNCYYITSIDESGQESIPSNVVYILPTVETITPTPFFQDVQCLVEENSVQMVNPYTFNNVDYNSNTFIGMGIGLYKLTGVTEDHPIGFVTESEHFTIIYGDEFDESTVEGINVSYYIGDIEINITGDFGTISYHCFNHGYMGGQNKLKYISECSISPEENSSTPTPTLTLTPAPAEVETPTLTSTPALVEVETPTLTSTPALVEVETPTLTSTLTPTATTTLTPTRTSTLTPIPELTTYCMPYTNSVQMVNPYTFNNI